MSRNGLAEIVRHKLETGQLRVIGGGSSGSSRGNDLTARALQPVPKRQPQQPAPARKDSRPDLPALTNAASVWSQSSVSASLERAPDVRRDKLRAVREFFAFLDKHLFEVTPMDVRDWLAWLETERGLAATTVYTMCSHLSGFFEWLRRQPELARFLPFNPVRAAFPKCPSPYQSARSRALSDEALRRLWLVMEEARETGSLVAARDYAIFRFFAATGDRRAEVLNLRGSDIELHSADSLTYYPRAKGGNRSGKRIDDPEVVRALVDYVRASNRRAREVFGRDVPLWLAHDKLQTVRSVKNTALAKPKKAKGLSSHAFDKRMKIYAERAYIFNFHLHQLRHTFARIVSEETGSLAEAQEALGHKSMKTTRVYVSNVRVRSDAHSSRLKARVVNKL